MLDVDRFQTGITLYRDIEDIFDARALEGGTILSDNADVFFSILERVEGALNR